MVQKEVDAVEPPALAGYEDPELLVREGLELLANFRRIVNADARLAVMRLVTSIVEAERQAAGR